MLVGLHHNTRSMKLSTGNEVISKFDILAISSFPFGKLKLHTGEHLLYIALFLPQRPRWVIAQHRCGWDHHTMNYHGPSVISLTKQLNTLMLYTGVYNIFHFQIAEYVATCNRKCILAQKVSLPTSSSSSNKSIYVGFFHMDMNKFQSNYNTTLTHHWCSIYSDVWRYCKNDIIFDMSIVNLKVIHKEYSRFLNKFSPPHVCSIN